MKVYDVIVDSKLNKCKQLYKALLMVDCQRMDSSYTCYLRNAVKKGQPHYVRYAYRICVHDSGIISYNSYRDSNEVSPEYMISLTNFINVIKPERTVKI